MIARMWHGTVPLEKADEYQRLMREVAIPDYSASEGNVSAFVLRRDEGGMAHFTTLTFWRSLDAIKAFAGEDAAVAKYYNFDPDFLVELVPHAEHYEAFDK